MLYPSIDKLLDKVDSKYSLVVAASKRARFLRDGAKSELKKTQDRISRSASLWKNFTKIISAMRSLKTLRSLPRNKRYRDFRVRSITTVEVVIFFLYMQAVPEQCKEQIGRDSFTFAGCQAKYTYMCCYS